MIRWCSYCQAFLGEIPPLDSMLVTHSVCPTCAAASEASESSADALVDATDEVRDLMNRIFRSAERGDDSAIATLLVEAEERRLSPESVLVGLLQPALYRAGEAWRDGSMSVAAEHRLTLWCERFLVQLPWPRPEKQSLDALFLVMPGNTHTVGPRVATQLLAMRGLSTQVIVPELPIGEMVEEIERLRPRVIGISCALATSLPEADDLLVELAARIEPSWPRRFLLGGFAVRSAHGSWVSAVGAAVVATLQEAEDVIRA